jgi:hypothetical protein
MQIVLDPEMCPVHIYKDCPVCFNVNLVVMVYAFSCTKIAEIFLFKHFEIMKLWFRRGLVSTCNTTDEEHMVTMFSRNK